MARRAVGRQAIRSVLAVDDDQRVLEGLARWLRRHYHVHTASDPDEAARLTRKEKPDLAIVDMRLGASSGIDLVRALRALAPDMVIVLISGYLSIDSTVVAMRSGADYVMSKPITGRDIVKRIDGTTPWDEWGETPTLANAEAEHIARVLSDCHGNISEAARRLDIDRATLQRRLRKRDPRS